MFNDRWYSSSRPVVLSPWLTVHFDSNLKLSISISRIVFSSSCAIVVCFVLFLQRVRRPPKFANILVLFKKKKKNSHHFIIIYPFEGRWGTTDDFATSFLHFSLFSTALWNLANSRPVHSLCCLPTSSSVCLVFFPLSLCLARWFWPVLMNGRYDHTTAVCVSLPWSGLRAVRLPAGSWHGLPRW